MIYRCHFSKSFRFIARKMTTHMEKTKDIARNTQVTSAAVEEIYSISPTIKKLVMRVHNSDFHFYAGQWVDFIIPGVSTVGGYSMCSAPTLLKEKELLQLAVKYAKHPPAHWIHTKCKTGDVVQMQCGGPFYHISSEALSSNVLLIAAGVGINPMLSIYHDIYDTHVQYSSESFGKTKMLYTATSKEELVFKDTIEYIASKDKLMNYKLFTTKKVSVQKEIENRRIKECDIEEAVEVLSTDPANVISYICGPSPMMEEMNGILIKQGLLRENIRYEKWW